MAALALVTGIGLYSWQQGGKKAASSPGKWEFGYWDWAQYNQRGPEGAKGLGTVYALARELNSADFRYTDSGFTASLPQTLPEAKTYWAVLRWQQWAPPPMSSVKSFAGTVENIRADARERRLPLAGIQLDTDCPTAQLGQYAAFLRELRKGAPGTAISITALLDWFRPGTEIGAVIDAVDEFVPQFYDTEAHATDGRPQGIAAPVEAARWGPVFQKFRKPYRIGISTFGRVRMPSGQRSSNGAIYSGLSTYELGRSPDMELSVTRTKAQELALRYRARKTTRVHWETVQAGDGYDVVMPTKESVVSAVAEARRMGDYCAGVVFFRWPVNSEALTLEPEEVLRWTGAAAAAPEVGPSVRVIDEQCAAVRCYTLMLGGSPAWSAKAVRYRVTPSSKLEYFLPEKETGARLTADGWMELVVPPMPGRRVIPIGRAVAGGAAEFRLEVMP